VAAMQAGDMREHRALVAERDAAYMSQVEVLDHNHRLRRRLSDRLRASGKVSDPEACVSTFMRNKTCDARLLDRAVSKQLKTFAGKRCYVLARSASRELVLHVPRYHLYATFGNAYAYHRRDLVPASWCSSDQPEDIQRFYESSFYGRTLPPIADSIVVFEVQVVRVSARHGRIISD
jgi:hypothetical protein